MIGSDQFLAELFRGTQGQIYVCALRNKIIRANCSRARSPISSPSRDRQGAFGPIKRERSIRGVIG